jgi:uncharacterized peroxidase-related enzyme
VQHGAALVRESGDAALPEAVVSGKLEELDVRLRALCEYAFKLTLTPHEMSRADVERLRVVGLDDRGIVDANQVVSYFNYVNRVADGLGVELEDTWPEEVQRPRTYGFREVTRPGSGPARA